MLGAELTLIEGTSNKIHKSLLVDRFVAVRFGRRQLYGQQTQLKEFPTAEKAHAYYWNLLRGKVAKGYHVVDAAVLPEPDRSKRMGRDWLDADWWFSLWTEAAFSERAVSRQRPTYGLDSTELSPRTPKQGAQVIADLVREDCPAERLMQCGLAPEAERFLRSMAYSHPNCPDGVHVAGYLAELRT